VQGTATSPPSTVQLTMVVVAGVVEAVIFDLDGVIVDSERVWVRVRRAYTDAHGGRYLDEADRAMQGMSSVEWSRYMASSLHVPLDPEVISREVAEEVAAEYHRALPLLPGAVSAVRGLAERFRLGLASSANRSLIDLVLDESGLAPLFAATVSSEEVERGKPAPDVYLEAASRVGVAPGACAAVEDSSNGLRAAAAAGMRVVAVPNRDYPPVEDALKLADLVLPDIAGLTPSAIERL
jgi:HAD superfamily hydrolase (TIGR01509 family)